MIRIAALFALALPLGCSREEPIRVYTAPKPVEVTYRILGGIFPADDPAWFFKVSGRSDELAPHAAEIEKFIASIRFLNGPQNPPLWDLPSGWKTGGPNEMKMATETFLFGSEEKPIVLTMSSAKGGFDMNLARWVKQVGLTYDGSGKDKYCKPLGTPPKGWLVDITGPNNPSAARGPMQGRM